MKRFLVFLVIFATAGCIARTSIPRRFTVEKGAPDKCGYHVQSQGKDGFILEVVQRKYTFMPNADPTILAARECFGKMASRVAEKQGRAIVQPTAVDMATTVAPQAIDGYFLVYITGRVWFAK